MIVEIGKDIVDYLKKYQNNLTLQSAEIKTLESVATECERHHHIIFAEYDVLIFLKSLPLLGQHAKSVFNYLARIAYSLPQYKKLVCSKIKLWTEKSIMVENGIIYVPLNESKFFSKSLLICENLTDCDFYVCLVKEMLEEQHLNVCLSLHQLHCGGSLAYETISNEVHSDNLSPILCIMDSDKKYEESSIGASAKSAEKAFREWESFYPISEYTLPVREKENVVPPNILILARQLNSNALLQKLALGVNDEECYGLLKYFDIKGCASLDKLRIECERHSLALEKLGMNLSNSCNENLLMDGIGSNGIELFKKEILNHECDNHLKEAIDRKVSPDVCKKLQKQVDRSHQLIAECPPYYLSVWKQIQLLLVTYGIAFPENICFIA